MYLAGFCEPAQGAFCFMQDHDCISDNEIACRFSPRTLYTGLYVMHVQGTHMKYIVNLATSAAEALFQPKLVIACDLQNSNQQVRSHQKSVGYSFCHTDTGQRNLKEF